MYIYIYIYIYIERERERERFTWPCLFCIRCYASICPNLIIVPSLIGLLRRGGGTPILSRCYLDNYLDIMDNGGHMGYVDIDRVVEYFIQTAIEITWIMST